MMTKDDIPVFLMAFVTHDRYLESAFMNLDLSSFKLVYEALEERAYLLNAAPYIVRPLPIMIPIYSVWQVDEKMH